MLINKENSVPNIVLFLLVILAPMMIIKYSVFTIFFVFMIFSLVYVYIYAKKIYLTKDFFVNFIFCELIISSVLALFSDIWISYKKCVIIVTCLYIPIYFIYAFFEASVYDSRKMFRTIARAIRLTCVIQLVWCLLQLFAYKILGIDINQIIFGDFFHFVDVASCYKDGKFLPSGFCWHAAFVAPITIFGYLFSNNIWIKGLAVVDAIVCGNSTALIGIVACVCADILFRLIKIINNTFFKTRKSILYIGIFLLGMGTFLAFKFDLVDFVWDKLWYTYQRATGGVADASADAHIRYYTSYLEVLDFSTVIQVVFGYGFGCSGYPFSVLYDQYSYLKSWVTETDIMNILLSRGVLGFLGYYSFLAYIALQGLRLDYRYFVLIASLALCGITYNIQFDWVFLLELLIYLSVKYRDNLFEYISE